MSEYCFTSLSAQWGNIATEGSPKSGLCPTLISNDFNQYDRQHYTIHAFEQFGAQWQISGPTGIRTWYFRITSPSRYEWAIRTGLVQSNLPSYTVRSNIVFWGDRKDHGYMLVDQLYMKHVTYILHISWLSSRQGLQYLIHMAVLRLRLSITRQVCTFYRL